MGQVAIHWLKGRHGIYGVSVSRVVCWGWGLHTKQTRGIFVVKYLNLFKIEHENVKTFAVLYSFPFFFLKNIYELYHIFSTY